MSGYPKAVAAGWFPIAMANQVNGVRPLSRQLMGKPLALFRAATGVAVFLDRCPHRNMALSQGRVRGGEIECPYHGWRFGPDGRCTLTPGADGPAPHGAEVLASVVHDGLVWATLNPDPSPFPALPHPMGAAGFDSFWWPVRPARAALIDAIENLLDPAHPHFLHAGFVRSATTRRPISVTVCVGPDRAEAIYTENARASALIPRLLEGLRTTSSGRFFPPAIGQIAFDGPTGPQLAITVFFTPESPDRVRPFAHFATPKGRAPPLVKEWVLRALNAPVLAQDRAALRAQHETITAFGAPRFAQGPLDFLRPAIQALADGERPEASERVVQVRL